MKQNAVFLFFTLGVVRLSHPATSFIFVLERCEHVVRVSLGALKKDLRFLLELIKLNEAFERKVRIFVLASPTRRATKHVFETDIY